MLRSAPLLPVTLGFIAGVMVGLISGYWAMGLLMISLLCCRQRRLFLTLLTLLLFLTGLLYIDILEDIYKSHPFIRQAESEVTLWGRVWEAQTEVLVLDRILTVEDGEQIPVRGRAQIILAGLADKEFVPGTYIQLQGRPVLPKAATNPGTFDLRSYLKHRFIYICVYTDPGCIVLVDKKVSTLFRIRDFIKQHLAVNLYQPVSGLLQALLLGDKDKLTEAELLREAGISHILAISGMHVGFVALLIWGLLLLIPLPETGRRVIFAMIMVGYIVLVGGSPSVVRAGVFVILTNIASIWGRRASPLNNLCLTALLVLFINPYELILPGFQLSFSITFFLIYSYPVLKKFSNSWTGRMAGFSIIATLASFPFTAYHFQTGSPLNIIANFWAVPLAAVCVISGCLGFLPLVGTIILKYITYPAGLLLLSLSQWWGTLPGAQIILTPPTPYFTIAWFGLLMAGLFWLRPTRIPAWRTMKNRLCLYLLPLVLVIFILAGVRIPWQEVPLVVTFLDVGQGDCIHLQFPEGVNILIDGGGYRGTGGEAVGRHVITPYLYQKGVKKLDWIIISHFHEDHYRGLIPVMETFDVGVVAGPPLLGGAQEEEIMSLLARAGKEYLPLMRGWVIQGNDWIMEVLHPGERIIPISPLNNNSVVLELNYRNWRLLFTGDIEHEAEKELLEGGYVRRCDLLKVAHHGSSTSSSREFISACTPQVAVISVGPNYFGHPAPEVIKTFIDMGSVVYSTREYGAVGVYLGEKMQIKPYKMKEREIIPLGH